MADVLTDFPERFDGLTEATAVLPNGSRRELKIENAWFQNDRIVMKFAGVDSIEAAEELRDADICVPESDAVELEEGEFFDWQLEGCTAVTVDGNALGTVKELMRTGGTEVVDGTRSSAATGARSRFRGDAARAARCLARPEDDAGRPGGSPDHCRAARAT